jgi:hypothetical protein
MDKAKARTISKRVEELLAPLEGEFNVRARIAGGTFDPSADSGFARFTVEVAEIDEDGMAATREARDFGRYATAYGLYPGDLGREFTWRGERFRLTGINPNAPSYPILAERVADGKTFKFPREVARSIRREEA